MKRILLALSAMIVVTLLQSCSSTEEVTATTTPTTDTTVTTPITPQKAYTDIDVKTAMDEYVKAHTDKNGILEIKVLRDGQSKTMKLKFVKVHDPVAVLSPTSSFACTDFKDTQKDKKTKKINTYDIDFWLTPGADGKLTVIPEKTEIHKVNGKKLFDYDRAGNKIPIDTNT